VKPLDFKLKLMCAHGWIYKLNARVEGYKNMLAPIGQENKYYWPIVMAQYSLFPTHKENEENIMSQLRFSFHKNYRKPLWRRIRETFRF
jgi:hypothetical protein